MSFGSVSARRLDVQDMKMRCSERKRRGRKPTIKRRYNCSECGYFSTRLFNVRRHHMRMHTKTIKKCCCAQTFTRKSDLYHHIEDNHPSQRSSCRVSREKYKIYGSKINTLTHLDTESHFEDVTDCSESAVTRRSMRIQEQVEKNGKLDLKDSSSEPDNSSDSDYYEEFNAADYDDCDSNSYEDNNDVNYNCDDDSMESKGTSDDHQSMYSTSLASDESEASDDVHENVDDDDRNNVMNDTQDNIISTPQSEHDSSSDNSMDWTRSLPPSPEASSAGSNIKEHQISPTCESLSNNEERDLNMLNVQTVSYLSLKSDMKSDVKANVNVFAQQLPLKKRILQELNFNNIHIHNNNNNNNNNKNIIINNIYNNTLVKNEYYNAFPDGNKKVKVLFTDHYRSQNNKENMPPVVNNFNINIHANMNAMQSTNPLAQVWDDITSQQRNYLSCIDFDVFKLF